MRKQTLTNLVTAFIIILPGCSGAGKPAAYGNFEALEWTVSSGGQGKILWFDIQEGDALAKGQVVGQVDTTELSLQKKRLDNQIVTLRASLPDVGIQVEALREKKRTIEKERQRVNSLVQSGAADRKKLDQVDDELLLVERQIVAASSSLHREAAGILAQVEALEMQRDITAHRIEECTIVNPENGTVGLKFAKAHEFTAAGYPLYKLMDTREMTLHGWFTGELLPRLQVGNEVKVAIDLPGGRLSYCTGKIAYIAEKPEFTPSQVQTRQNRSLLLYHVKISVINDGTIKPGMPAEIYLLDLSPAE
ncbi:MAG: HlyD family efflux transporter periplasmic adaptor subunit [Bacteroidales bacterium]|jgi:HlyD family secretion protein|nr:HlyD family efflux transporter periplasmic adaptor subunit [Candidatus Cloacimonadota bacterium]MCK9326129.1 HlyD family efflux transporter periplasmic adaptor subunit [Bacteroidales bacterium]MDD3551664.1 HlyD family efflux transporter periplasmic adaptor subunit [Methanothrix soehngenii]NCC84389.1 HlyD family efflux transporter periplasmic adaptor subunit [Clostridia bacterium]